MDDITPYGAHVEMIINETIARARASAVKTAEGWLLDKPAVGYDWVGFDDGYAQLDVAVSLEDPPPPGLARLAVNVLMRTSGLGQTPHVRFVPPAARQRLSFSEKQTWPGRGDYGAAWHVGEICMRYGAEDDGLWLEPDGSTLFFIRLPDDPITEKASQPAS
jgi:hypothetical protein